MPQDDRARRDVAALVLDAPEEDPPRRRLVDGVRALEVVEIDRQHVRLEDPVDADQALDRLLRLLGLLEGVHEGDEPFVGRLGRLGLGPQLGETSAEGVGVLGEVPHVAAQQELGGQLGREGDPAAEGAHAPLGRIAIVAQKSSGVVDRELAGERVTHGAQ